MYEIKQNEKLLKRPFLTYLYFGGINYDFHSLSELYNFIRKKES